MWKVIVLVCQITGGDPQASGLECTQDNAVYSATKVVQGDEMLCVRTAIAEGIKFKLPEYEDESNYVLTISCEEQK